MPFAPAPSLAKVQAEMKEVSATINIEAEQCLQSPVLPACKGVPSGQQANQYAPRAGAAVSLSSCEIDQSPAFLIQDYLQPQGAGMMHLAHEQEHAQECYEQQESQEPYDYYEQPPRENHLQQLQQYYEQQALESCDRMPQESYEQQVQEYHAQLRVEEYYEQQQPLQESYEQQQPEEHYDQQPEEYHEQQPLEFCEEQPPDSHDQVLAPHRFEEQQLQVSFEAVRPQYSDQQAPVVCEGGPCLSWMLGTGKHPMVTDDEVSYIFDCLKSINCSVSTYGLEQVALAEGLCAPGEVDSIDPDAILRLALEQMLQTKSRNGTEDIFVVAGSQLSTGYKKKVPLHVALGPVPLRPEEMEVDLKFPTMTVLWDWNVKLQGMIHEDE